VRAKTVQEYIDAALPASRANLKTLRAILKKVAPRATEAIKWGTPVLEQGRILFAYKAHKAHINFMPTSSALKPFAPDLAGHKTGKDTIQLPHSAPIPKALIRKIAALRVKQVLEEGAIWRMRGK
jgi:uncharacterized protein YdhG (YjbR/CyaY superfamily)